MSSPQDKLAGLLAVAGLAVAPLLPASVEPGLAPARALCAPEPAPEAQPTPAAASAPGPRQRALADYVARRYRIALDAVAPLVAAAHGAAEESGLDPLLILAVIAVESRFNPIAESVMGAQGLMQVIPRFHRDKLAARGAEGSLLDPVTNIYVGAQILREYVRAGGSLETGLQRYNGAARDSSGRYARKVMAERARLAEALREAGRA